MRNFKRSDFRGWYRKMDPDLLDVIDKFADLWSGRVWVSPAEGAIGRKLNPPNQSFHNFLHHGRVMAIDLMMEDLKDGKDFQEAFEIAKEVGALGVGLYPDWRPVPGIHLDVGGPTDSPKRKNAKIGRPAAWSAFRIDGVQKYFGVEKAFEI